MRSGFWSDVRWGLRGTWSIGIWLFGLGLLLYVIRGFPGLAENWLASVAGIAIVPAYITLVGAIIGACRPLLARGKAGAVITGSICGLLVMSAVSGGMVIGRADLSVGGYVFMIMVGLIMGGLLGAAYVEGRAAADPDI